MVQEKSAAKRSGEISPTRHVDQISKALGVTV